MLVISREQMNGLNLVVLKAFEDRTLAHLQHYFPGHCRLLGDDPMRLVIQQGRQRAASHGLTLECCARSYIEFMCLLGSGFDVDPLLPWAAQILGDRASPDQVARGDRFYDRAWLYIRSIVPDYRDSRHQPNTARLVGALRELMRLSDQAPPAHDMPNWCLAMAARLQSTFAAKAGVVGAPAVLATVNTAVEVARGHGITGQRGMALCSALMFVLGREFDHDPLLPWASQALKDASLGSETERVDRLARQGVATLRRWWDQPQG